VQAGSAERIASERLAVCRWPAAYGKSGRSACPHLRRDPRAQPPHPVKSDNQHMRSRRVRFYEQKWIRFRER
jgi:hypothetical protein